MWYITVVLYFTIIYSGKILSEYDVTNHKCITGLPGLFIKQEYEVI